MQTYTNEHICTNPYISIYSSITINEFILQATGFNNIVIFNSIRWIILYIENY